MRSVLVKLDPASIARAKKLGAGNVSAGIRKALAKAIELHGDFAFLNHASKCL